MPKNTNGPRDAKKVDGLTHGITAPRKGNSMIEFRYAYSSATSDPPRLQWRLTDPSLVAGVAGIQHSEDFKKLLSQYGWRDIPKVDVCGESRGADGSTES
jgi:hypothetical protein